MRYAILFLCLFLTLFSAASAQTVEIYKQGKATVAVPASQYINVFAYGSAARVSKQVGGPANQTVPRFTLETNGNVTNNEVTFGPYTTATNILIEAGGEDSVLYSVGALAAPLPVLFQRPRIVYTQLAPVTYNVSSTLLASDMMVGITTSANAGGGSSTTNLTLPTGTLMDAATGLSTNQGFEWSAINTSTVAGATVTLVAGSGHTIVGDVLTQIAGQTTGAATSRWFTRKTAANTFITYRIQ